MANFGFSLRSTFGLLPKTDKIENDKIHLDEEFEKLNKFKESELLAEYNELDTYINSNEFTEFKKNILSLDYKKTEEYTKEQRYFKLKKDKRIINYFTILESNDNKQYLNTEESNDLQEYLNLNSVISSSEHANKKVELAGSLAEELQKEKDFQKLKKSKIFKTYFTILDSTQLSLHKELTDSDELTEYTELDELIKSGKLKEVKASLKAELKKEKNKNKDLAALKKHPDIKNYNKVEDKDSIEKPAALIELNDLSAYLTSTEYTDKLNSLVYTNTEEYKKETRYKELKANSKFKSYFKFLKSKQLNNYNALNDSKELNSYLELEAYVTANEYKQTIENLRYENSEGFKNEQRLKELNNNEQIKHWDKFKKSKPFALFLTIKDSELLNEYNELNELINSEKFIEYKTYMLDKDKYQKTEEYTKEQRYSELKNDSEIKWYFKIKDSDKFNEIKKWKVTFEDTFSENKLNDELWMNSYFWGKMLINDRYVLAGEKQYYTDNSNINLDGQTLKILTKKESAEGKVWHPMYGFSNQKFDYTSGMLSTAHSFRQLYGKFEAKIKIDSSNPVYQAFWLKGEKILPEIDVFKFNMDKANKMQMSSFVGEPEDAKNAKPSTSKLNGGSFAKDFYIYTVDWRPEKITWKINGVEVYSTDTKIPAEPLYILLSAGIERDPNGQDIQSTYEIDWVRCYEKVGNTE